MKTKKIIIVSFAFVFSIFMLWYLFIKESDYCISFKVKAATGTIFQGVNDWSETRLASDSENYVILEKKNFSFIKQEMKKDKMAMEYTWDINSVNDSVTSVSVGIKELNSSIYNRLTAPFFSTNFKKTQIQKITDFRNGLNKHTENFKIKIDGEGASEEVFVAYLNLQSVLQEKAQTMIRNDAVITGFLQQNNIKIVGKPYVEIQNWNLDKETLDFNYCFPVDKNTKLIENDVVKFKTIPASKGLQATYFGNFRTSDRAWFAILDYAKSHNLKLTNKPLEHFLANPFNGGDELTWETKVIIPFE
jgi:effector-binding domain-containing protein